MFNITKVKMHFIDDEHCVVVSNPDYCKMVFSGEHLQAVRLFEQITEKLAHAEAVGGFLVF